MKVLIFIDWFAPAYKAGGPIQSIVNLVNQPMDGFRYRVICSNKDLDGGLLHGVLYDTWVPFNAWTEVWYNSRPKKTKAVIKATMQWGPDVLYINGIYSFYYNLLPLVFRSGVKKIISARGMLHAGALSQKSFKKKLYLHFWKLLKIDSKNSFHATNKEEAEFIKKTFGAETAISVATNFPKILDNVQKDKKEVGALHLISIGLVSPMKNYLEVLNALALSSGAIRYTIYGSVKDVHYWQQCTDKIKELPPEISVEYKGDITPDKIQAALSEADVFILPSKSENFGHAIFEALSAGKPVVTSHKTPWNNLRAAKSGINISVDNEGELTGAINFFAAMNVERYQQWSAGARKYSEEAMDIEVIKEQYKRMFLGQSRPAPVTLKNRLPTF